MKRIILFFGFIFCVSALSAGTVHLPVGTDGATADGFGDSIVVTLNGDYSPATPHPAGTVFALYKNGVVYFVEVIEYQLFPAGGYVVKDLNKKVILLDKDMQKRVTRFDVEAEVFTSEKPSDVKASPEAILMRDEFFTAKDFIESGRGALVQGAFAGLSVLLYQGIIYDSAFRKTYEEYQTRKSNLQKLKKQSDAELKKSILEGFSSFDQSRLQIEMLSQNFAASRPAFDFSNPSRASNFRSKDPQFVQDLQDIRNTVDSVPKYDPRSLNLKRTAYELTDLADQAHFENNMTDALAYKKYALATADLLFGIDPVTGTFRSVYEGFSGFNFVTGERLSVLERSFAVMGMVTFGYGNKISQGLKGFSKIAGKALNNNTFSLAVRHAQASFQKIPDLNLYQRARLWNTERVLKKHHPKLWQDMSRKANSTDYFKYAQDRQGLKIKNSITGEMIEQDMSIEAFEAIERIEKKGQLARQGEFEWDMGRIKEELKAGRLTKEEVRKRIRGTKIQTVLDPEHKSVFYGEVTDDLLSAAHADKYGVHSSEIDFAEIFDLPKGTPYITRPAPAGIERGFFDKLSGKYKTTKGGAIEAIVSPDTPLKFNRLILP